MSLKNTLEFEFGKVSEIIPHKKYINKIFLTVDIDWASDEIVNLTLDIFEQYDVPVTFFATHKSSTLERIRKNSKWDLGIHPNFNFLLDGDFRYGSTVEEVVDYYMDIVPEATIFRSHCVVQGSKITDAFVARKFIAECNHFIPYNIDTYVPAWNFWSGPLVQIPYSWQDNTAISDNWSLDVSDILQSKSLKIFDFHPVHIYLNTSDMQEYESFKSNPNNNDVVVYQSRGIRDYLYDLLQYAEVKKDKTKLFEGVN